MTSVDDIIFSMLDSYNTSNLKDLPEDLREALYEEAKKCLENPGIANNPERCNERKTLMILINNHLLNNKPVSDFIKGPFSVTLHWNSDLKMMIYIFGELHRSNTDCNLFPKEKSVNGTTVPVQSMFIEDYLKQLLVNTDCYIDFYLEEQGHIGYDPVLRPHNRSERLSILRDRFMECISDIKRRNTNPSCRVSRSHYFDIRYGTTDQPNDLVVPLITNLSLLLKSGDENIKANIYNFFMHFMRIKHDKKFYSFINSIHTITSDKEFVEFLNGHVFFNHLFLLKKMERSFINKTILPFILNEIELAALKYKRELQDTLTSLFSFNNKYRSFFDITGKLIQPTVSSEDTDKILKDVKRFRDILMHFCTPMADAYLLSRVFKVFDIYTDKPEKKRGFDEPQIPHNVIIYGGDNHANRYRKFLETHMNFKRLEQNTYDHKIPVTNCINMNGITQPLFSYIPTNGFQYYLEPYQPILLPIFSKKGKLIAREDEDLESYMESNMESNMDYEGEDDSKVNPENLFSKNIFGQYGNFSDETTNEKQSTRKNRPNPYANSKERRRL